MSWQKSDPIPMERVSQFVRQITHDVRNGLNAIDLQAAYLAEIVQDDEAKQEAQRLRSMVRDTTQLLQSLSRKVQEPTVEVIDCPADMLLETLESRIAQNLKEGEGAGEISWTNEANGTEVVVDVESLIEIVTEVLRNAIQFAGERPQIQLRALVEEACLILEIKESNTKEPEADPATWGCQPLVTARRGGYGLSLFKARASLAAQGGTMTQVYHTNRREVVSRISLPLTKS